MLTLVRKGLIFYFGNSVKRIEITKTLTGNRLSRKLETKEFCKKLTLRKLFFGKSSLIEKIQLF